MKSLFLKDEDFLIIKDMAGRYGIKVSELVARLRKDVSVRSASCRVMLKFTDSQYDKIISKVGCTSKDRSNVIFGYFNDYLALSDEERSVDFLSSYEPFLDEFDTWDFTKSIYLTIYFEDHEELVRIAHEFGISLVSLVHFIVFKALG